MTTHPMPHPQSDLDFGDRRLLDLTLPTIAENLALDEALLAAVETDPRGPVMRFWESSEMAVVLGASGRRDRDVHLEACQADGVSLARRSSGGGTVVVGPGALNVAVVLPIAAHPEFEAVDRAQVAVLEQLASYLRALAPAVEVRGSGDLTLGGRKFSGSAQRRVKRHFLVHATILYDFPLDQVPRYLAEPDRQPEYRAGRSHRDFVVNLPLARDELVACLRRGWATDPVAMPVPWDDVRRLVVEKFADPAWIGRL